ncbi:hypothetical protein ASE12_08660 [Aeromicrobium sp. Root236]|uniref:CU044_5270 family protein n=1 Tax=Aeromicrobium sp. Root236 TaxID=1736498 RepID=UPI0007013841|nr:CU044_5270 family protein [Aeromicrobium sp. Root236]KRC64834.1 hypothetical protein ASE12_08660 [Aeromicrobium sp. Root236]
MSSDDDQVRGDVELLRQTALDSGLDPRLDPDDLGVRLDSADELLARITTRPDELAARRRRPVAALAATAVAATAALVLGVLQPWQSSPASAETPPVLDFEFANAQDIATVPGKDAAPSLRRLAIVAGRFSEPAGQGKVQHVVTDNWFGSIDDDKGADSIALIPTLNETWLSPDGSFRLIERTGRPLSPDGRGVTAQASQHQPSKADETQPADSFDPLLLSSLPKDPARLRAEVLKVTTCGDESPRGRAACLFSYAQEYNSTYVVPTRVTAALWSLLADEPSVRLLGEVRDRAGRPGVGVSVIPADRDHYRLVLIISPRTGQLLGTEEILIKRVPELDVSAPAITQFTAFLSAERVSRAGPAAP